MTHNMNSFPKILERGVVFVRNNPQIIYTLFLVIAIPLAFFFTSEKFLKVARENQDRLERGRIGLLQDTFALFARDRMNEPEYLGRHIAEIAGSNETIINFQILGEQHGNAYTVLASLDETEIGTLREFDPLSSFLLSAAGGDRGQVYAQEFFLGGARYWRSARAIDATSSNRVAGFILTDISMAQADSVARGNIRDAYIVLGVIILLIVILLGRQARIIDYASLYARLKEVDQMKDDFVSMAAHELRSPLTIIRGYVDMLDGGDRFTDAERQNLKNIDNAAVQLNGLIGDILDVAKLQEGRMSFRFQSHDVSSAIDDVVAAFMKPAHDKGLALSYEKKSLPLISVDPDRFRQVMVNLVGNAIKYTPKGEVRVITSTTETELMIRVSDTGMGISAEDQQKLFQKFFRVKNEETQAITGTGLGLWITTQMVKQMKGNISVESIRGKGTDFIVIFPLTK